MMYNKLVEQLFFSANHAGLLDKYAQGVLHCVSKQKSSEIDLYVRCSIVGAIEVIRYRARGNPYLIAGLEWLCGQVEGKNIHHMTRMTHDVLIKALAIPHAYYPTAVQIISTFNQLIDKSQIGGKP